ncbi:MAG: DUF2723 domain-containing protein [Bacteroidia bacterium]|nr:DUF2723 domain-containing protein [Bacteroidia bacterium]
MKQFKLINNITGWVVFVIAAFTYLMTIEPTASLWDCGEFIASSYKLEVGHPPGSQVFMVLARFFTLFAGKDVTKVAAMVNAMSAIFSAFTILFLFWTITHLARKIIVKNESDFTNPRIIAIMSAGVVGALAFTFSDSFWFSAVEGEVYATSSMFTAAVFWAILKWEEAADEKNADRWIILIAYLMGLSIGVHLLNLLALPAIVLVYYFRKFEFSWKGLVYSLAGSFIILALLLWGMLPGIVKVSSLFDLFFVNSLKLPPNSGMIFHMIILAVLLIFSTGFSLKPGRNTATALLSAAALLFTGIWVVSGSAIANCLILVVLLTGIWLVATRNRVMLNTALTAIIVILIGYSSTALIMIRASANPPLNENNPSDPFNLLYYINREQYGQMPLIKGAYYNAPLINYKDGKPVYVLEKGKYVITHKNLERVYDDRFITLFPRMWSDQEDHAAVYKQWGGSKGISLQVTDQEGKKTIIKRPTFSENLRFMFTYQYGYMYFRYFMWNFSGKQNDTQGSGGAINGNWITGIKFLDEPRVGTSDLPEDIKNDTSRNRYFLLPFLLGMAGLLFQLFRDNKNWWIIMLLFVMTGIAIIFYLNQYPNQPRERDYAYVGSFYFFSVWIGLGVLALYDLIKKVTSEGIAAPVSGILCLFAVPVIMGSENWNDHDRSGRYLARDVAFDYLESCAPDAILFTNGDNDTFPLWYAQEVEGKRTDVRVCNLMLMNTDWYIEQMKRKVYKSDPLPVSLPIQKYYDGINSQLYIFEKRKEPVDISTIIDWVKSENRGTKLQVSANEWLDIIPAKNIRIPIDKNKVLASGTVSIEDSAKIVPYIDISLKGSLIIKSQLLVLDILAHNDWKRPIYFVAGYHGDALGLEEYFQLEGLAYRLVPIKSENRSWLDYGSVNTDVMYENLMKKFAWGGANDPKVNIDYHHKRTLMVVRARLNYAKLAQALVSEGKNEKAAEVLDHCMNVFPLSKIPYDPYMNDIIDAYFAAGKSEKAMEMTNALCSYYYAQLDYYLKQKPYIVASAEYPIGTAFEYTRRAGEACIVNGKKETGMEISNKLNDYYKRYVGLINPATR